MKILRYTYIIAIAALTAVMAACSSDSIETDQPNQNGGGDLTLRISTGMTTRARATNWADTNAQDEEMMNLWVVVVTNTSNGAVQKFIACRPSAGTEREIDDVARITQGAYTIYSFANISINDVCDLLNINITTMTDIGSTPTEFETTGTVSHSDVAALVTMINGNGFDPTAADNGFGETGIPMSNVQTTTATDSSKDLIVVRLLAKLQVSITNNTGDNVTVKSMTISDITSNGENLKLLPSLSYPDDMDAHHMDIRPNLKANAATGDFTITLNETLVDEATVTKTFYINESATPTNAEGLFYLTLEVESTNGSEYRYALISNNATNEWNYIARNDYRIIPITLDNLKFEVIPYDFPPIGVYPCSVKEIDATNHVYEFTFHDYGHFHLLPRVTKEGEVVTFSATTPTGTGYKWTLIDNDWSKSFFTYAAKGDATQTANPGSFYRTGTGSTVSDGDEEGQTPVWYPNTTGKPQWDPDLQPGIDPVYEPFIFGYIADPGTALTADKRVYHEMKIQVYNGTTAYRQMLYRFYMTLSADQMLYAPAMGTPAPRRSHHQKVD